MADLRRARSAETLVSSLVSLNLVRQRHSLGGVSFNLAGHGHSVSRRLDGHHGSFSHGVATAIQALELVSVAAEGTG
jgi:hypothetical protein